jgi:hypothetical protein
MTAELHAFGGNVFMVPPEFKKIMTKAYDEYMAEKEHEMFYGIVGGVHWIRTIKTN